MQLQQAHLLKHFAKFLALRGFQRLDRRQEAIDAYIEAINLLSGGHWMQRELHDRVVSLYRASGRLDDLVKYCRDQVARSPEQTAVRALLADVLAAAGKPDEGKAALAEAILAHRAENGPFSSVDELVQVKGIGAASLEKMRPHCYVGDGGAEE